MKLLKNIITKRFRVPWKQIDSFERRSVEGSKEVLQRESEGNALCAIDFHEGDSVVEAGVKALVLEAVRLNKSKSRAIGF